MLTAALGTELHEGTAKAIYQRIRSWVDGLVIGSEIFVRTVMAAHHSRAATRRIDRKSLTDPPLACWRRLRSVI
jgi:hypothetical protein